MSLTTDPELKANLEQWFPRNVQDNRCNQRMSSLQLMITGQKAGNVTEEIENSKEELDHQDSRGTTALVWAVRCARADVVEMLLSRGADPFQVNSSGQTALHMAAMHDHTSIPMLLGLGINVNLRDNWGQTAMHLAARRCHVHPSLYISPLLDAGADINAQEGKGRTALHAACIEEDNTAAVKYLIDKGADLNLPDQEGDAPINMAIQWEHAACVETLIVAGARCNGVTSVGANILHYIARWGDIATMKVLADWHEQLKDLDVNLEDDDGIVPLRYVEMREDVSSSWIEVFDDLVKAILGVQDENASRWGSPSEVYNRSRETKEGNSRGPQNHSSAHEANDFSEGGSDFEFFEDCLEEQDGSAAF